MYLGRKHVASKKVRFQEKEGQNRSAVSKLKRRQLSTARAENTWAARVQSRLQSLCVFYLSRSSGFDTQIK